MFDRFPFCYCENGTCDHCPDGKWGQCLQPAERSRRGVDCLGVGNCCTGCTDGYTALGYGFTGEPIPFEVIARNLDTGQSTVWSNERLTYTRAEAERSALTAQRFAVSCLRAQFYVRPVAS